MDSGQAKSVSFNSSKDLLEVHSISDQSLKKDGWAFAEVQVIVSVPTYTKDGKTVIYRCHKWFYNNSEVQFMEELK